MFRFLPNQGSRLRHLSPQEPFAESSAYSFGEQRAASRREVRATLSLTLFVLSQWVLPQSLLLQSAKGRSFGMAPAQAATAKTATSAKASAKPSSASDGKVASGKAAPTWYRAAHLKDVQREGAMKQHQANWGSKRVLLAQNTDTIELPGATIRRVKTAKDKAVAVLGPPLVEGVFPVDLRPSAPLSPAVPVSHVDLDLSNDRVPSQAEITAEGSLAGPLSPVAPAEAEVYAEQVDQQLKEAGFEQGLNTVLPAAEQAIARGLPGLAVAAKNLDEAKKKVKKARDQNREFARAMQKWNRNQFKEASDDFQEYVEKYPLSPWTPEAMIHIANYAKYTGRGNDSEGLYRRVIEMTSNDPNDPSYTVHRKAFGRLTDLYLIEGRYGEVRPMLEDLLYNDTNWSRRTWGLYWLTQINALQNDSKRLLAERDCGAQALAALLAQTDHPRQAREIKALQPTDPRGFSLADLRSMSARRGVPLLGFEATPAQLARLPLPLLLHYAPATGSKVAPAKTADAKATREGAASSQHFVLLRSYDARRDVWDVLNPQDGMSARLSSPQLVRQWSGRGLMLASRPKKRAGAAPIPSFATGRVINASFDPRSDARPQASTPTPVKRLSPQEMSATFGAGYAVKQQTNIGENDENIPMIGCRPQGQPSYGSPSVSINPISQNIYITDTPVWYSPSKGPDVLVTLSYNSLDASTYGRRIGGNKWIFNYGSYIVDLPGRSIVYMPDGAQIAFPYQQDPSGGTVGGGVQVNPRRYYTSPRGVFLRLEKDAVSGQYTLTTPEGEKMVYNGAPTQYQPDAQGSAVGFLQSQTDRFGYSLTVQYGLVSDGTPTGKYSVPVSVTDADGRKTTFQYDKGRLIYAQTPDQRQASFSYDSNNNLIQFVDVAGQAFQYSYDDMGIVSQLNTMQGSWDFTVEKEAYNGSFRKYRTTVSNPEQNSRFVDFFTDDGNYHDGRYASTDYRGNATLYTIAPLNDSNGQLYTNRIASVQQPWVLQPSGPQPSGLKISYAYTNAWVNEPTSISRPGLTTNLTYNSRGRVERATQIAGDGATRTLDITMPNGGIDVTQVVLSGTLAGGVNPLSQTLYQASNYLYHLPQKVTDAGGHVTDVTYTPWGAPATVKTYEGATTHTTTYSYGTAAGNDFGRLTGVSYDGVAQGAYTYDLSGRVKTATDVPAGLTTRYQYNNLDALVGTYYPDNTKELIEYTCCTLPGMATDRSGKKTYYDYDALKRLVRVQDAEGQTLQMDYDADGNQTGLLDAKGQQTRWSYDVIGRTVAKRYPDGTTESTHMAVEGWADASTNGRGQTTFYTHNDFGDLTQVDVPGAVYYIVDPGHDMDVDFGYDALGRLTTMNDGVGITSWNYTGEGQLRSENGPWASDTVIYSYDILDRWKNTSVQRSATSGDVDFVVPTYDSLSRVSALTATLGGTSLGSFGLAYRGDSDDVTSLTRPNGTQAAYTYEAGGLKRLVGVQNKTNAGVSQSNFQSGFNYGSFRDNYSHVGRTYGDPAAGAPTQTVTYNYTPTSMLKSEYGNAGGTGNPLVSKNYQFDPMGNRTQSRDMAAKVQVDSSYNRLNQLTGQTQSDITGTTPVLQSTTSYGYDADGNQTSATTQQAGGGSSQTQYVYDPYSRLVSVEVPGVSRHEFTYDGLDRLRVSLLYTWNGNGWNAPVEKRRTYDGMDVVQERNVDNQVTASVVRAGNIGGVLARVTYASSTTSAGGASFYGYDLQGNVVTLTDGAGAVVGSYNYDAWGNVLNSLTAQAGENPYRFSTKESLGGMYSFGYRFYNPGTGRWINRDPIRESGGVNLYAMVGNDPVNMADEYGLSPSGGGISRGPSVIDAGGVTGQVKVTLTSPFTGKRNYVPHDISGNALIMPYYASVEKNIKAAQSPGSWLNPYWFYTQVRNKGPMDYKQSGPEFADFGNFNYGVVGRAAGITRNRLLSEAGAAQVKAGTSQSGWGCPNNAVGFGGTPPYGDDPRDQAMIIRGMDWYDKLTAISTKRALEKWTPTSTYK